MAFKMGGLGLSTFAGENNLGGLLLDGKHSQNGHDKFSVPAKISVQTTAGEDPVKVHERMLRQAASRAGLDGTQAQETFVKKYASGIKFDDPKKDPSPADNLNVKAGEVKTENVSYTLGQDEIATLKSLQKEYAAAGGKLHPGKSYESAHGATESDGSAAASQVKNNEAYQRDKLNNLFREAQVLPTTFGTPSKLRDLKHISVTLPEKLEAGVSNEDHALLAYIQKTYGGGNLQGDNIKEILDLAKQSGVRAENLAVENPKAEFDLSVESLLKLHSAYVGVQAKTNALVDLYQQTADNSVASRFLKGAVEGAWEDLKANGQAIADPIGTAQKLAEVAQQLASIDPVLIGKAMLEAAGNAPALLEQGATAIGQTKVADAAEMAGRAVGTAVVEAVLAKGGAAAFKGIAFLGKTESGVKLLQQIGGATQKAKAAIGALEIPVGAKAVEIALEGGRSIKLPMLETKRLDELLKPLETRAKQALSGAAESVKAINLPAWEKLTFKVDEGEKLPHFLTGHKTGESRLTQSISSGGKKDIFPSRMSDNQIINSIKTAYKNSKKLETQIRGNGEKVAVLLGESDGMKIKMYVNVTTKELETAFPQWR